MPKKPFAFAVALAASTLLLACGDGTTDPPNRLVTNLECEPDATTQFNCAMTLTEGGIRGYVAQLRLHRSRQYRPPTEAGR